MKKGDLNLFLIASVLFYAAAVICFFTDDRSMGVVWLSLGSAFLCLGAVKTNKAKEDEDNDEQ